MPKDFSSSLSSKVLQITNILDEYFITKDRDKCKDLIEEILTFLGIDATSHGEECLKLLDYDDFSNAFTSKVSSTDIYPIPKLRLKLMFNILTQGLGVEVSKDPISHVIKNMRPYSQWSNLELLEVYNKDSVSAIQEELTKRSKSRYVIVFNDDGSIDIETSLFLLKKANYQDTPSCYKLKSGDIKEVYRIGDFPMQIFYECPMHSDTILLDGYCEECGNYWDVLDTERNAFFRLLANHKKIDSHHIPMYKDMEFSKFIASFPKIYVEYMRLSVENKLPNLKRRLSSPNKGDPFRIIGSNKVY